jgi:K+-transporting ATPase ATPase C chain
MKTLLSDFVTALFLTLMLIVVCCVAYPAAVWAAGQAFFHDKADGSLIVDKSGVVRGSMLLAQSFASDKYFQPRPSAAGTGYDSTNSSGTNYGPTSANGLKASDPVPADAVTRSASGLDPQISVANALLQSARVAKARHASIESVQALITRFTQDRDLGIFGESGVNVLLLNLAMDQDFPVR